MYIWYVCRLKEKPTDTTQRSTVYIILAKKKLKT